MWIKPCHGVASGNFEQISVTLDQKWTVGKYNHSWRTKMTSLLSTDQVTNGLCPSLVWVYRENSYFDSMI